MTYFVEISRAVMVRGAGLGAVTEPLLLLATLGVAVFGLALARARRDLVPARGPRHAAEANPTPEVAA